MRCEIAPHRPQLCAFLIETFALMAYIMYDYQSMVLSKYLADILII